MATFLVAIFVATATNAALSPAIMAGDELGLPADSPSNRLDPHTTDSLYNFVGALHIVSGGWIGIGSAAAISPHWVLTAGHNVDFNDDGAVDDDLSVVFHLPGLTSHAASAVYMQPSFTGFANPSIHHDLALLYFDEPLPTNLAFPALGLSLQVGDVATLVGFGRSGYGSYGYTTPVDYFSPNDFGLHDMAGNFWEWNYDWRPRYVGSNRVCRGGGWDGNAVFCLSGFRSGSNPSNRSIHIGFRVSSASPSQ